MFDANNVSLPHWASMMALDCPREYPAAALDRSIPISVPVARLTSAQSSCTFEAKDGPSS